jgi:hydrogenase nickel incorporation protein HypA/HybF
VSKIILEIGTFSGVEVDALDFAFSVFKKGTIIEAATIEYITPPLILFCKHCGTEYLGEWEDLQCQELKVKSIAGEVDGCR